VDLRNRFDSLTAKLERKMVSSKCSKEIFFDFESLTEDLQKDLFALNMVVVVGGRESSSSEVINKRFDELLVVVEGGGETMNPESSLYSIVLVAVLTALETTCALRQTSTLTPLPTATAAALPDTRTLQRAYRSPNAVSLACGACTFLNIGSGLTYCQMCNTKLPKVSVSASSVKKNDMEIISEVIVIDDSADEDDGDDRSAVIDLCCDSKQPSLGLLESKNFCCYHRVVRLRAAAESIHTYCTSTRRYAANEDSNLSTVSALHLTASELPPGELELLGLTAKKYSVKNPLQISHKRGEDASSPASLSSYHASSESESDGDSSMLRCFDVFGKRFGDPKRKGKSRFCGTILSHFPSMERLLT
jgi:hypothetical protein